MPPAKPASVSFHLSGSRQDAGLVRASDFVDWLEHVLSCLRRLEKSRRKSPETVYRISDLKIGSAVVTIEIDSPGDRQATSKALVSDFVKGAKAVQQGTVEKLPFDPDTKAAFAQLSAPLRRQIRQVTISSGRSKVSLQHTPTLAVVAPREVESISVGSFSGFIDALNVHSELLFYLYPTVGPSRIPCEFDRPHLETIRTAIKRYTKVSGAAEFAPGSPYPDRIIVDSLEVQPPLESLPTIRSLRGSVPALSQGMDSVTFVRAQRDAEP